MLTLMIFTVFNSHDANKKNVTRVPKQFLDNCNTFTDILCKTINGFTTNAVNNYIQMVL